MKFLLANDDERKRFTSNFLIWEAPVYWLWQWTKHIFFTISLLTKRCFYLSLIGFAKMNSIFKQIKCIVVLGFPEAYSRTHILMMLIIVETFYFYKNKSYYSCMIFPDLDVKHSVYPDINMSIEEWSLKINLCHCLK